VLGAGAAFSRSFEPAKASKLFWRLPKGLSRPLVIAPLALQRTLPEAAGASRD
jgi:hypothetical protein